MFDTTLIASNPRREVKGKFATLPAALAIHAMALGLVMVGQLWAVNDVPEPYVPIIFVPPSAPPAQGTCDGRGPGHPKPAHQAVRQQVVQPVEVPSEPAKAGTPADIPDDPRAVPFGDPNGHFDGVPYSVSEPEGPPPADDPPPEAPIVLSPEVTAPVPLVRTLPEYPELARKVRKEGVVIVQAVIDREGNVVSVEVLRDVGLGCGEAVAQAIRGWKYRPAMLDGRPVSVYLTVTVNFELRGVS